LSTEKKTLKNIVKKSADKRKYSRLKSEQVYLTDEEEAMLIEIYADKMTAFIEKLKGMTKKQRIEYRKEYRKDKPSKSAIIAEAIREKHESYFEAEPKY
jgi:hypothetical protein